MKPSFQPRFRAIVFPWLATVGFFFSTLAGATAQTPPSQPEPYGGWRHFHPSFYPVGQRPGKPQVLLIGDSVSMDYTLHVRGYLGWTADVHRPPMNCGSTKVALENIEAWLGDFKWDAIHFNWGLHDVQSTQSIPIEQYTDNLRTLVARLKQTGARLIWATTTPVPAGDKTRINRDVLRYNAAALTVMKDNGVQIDDLYGFIAHQNESMQMIGGVHFARNGSVVLAKSVALSVLTALGLPAELEKSR